jgi:hypothetical protein
MGKDSDMGLADRDYYREHTQELERQAEASASRFGGGGRRTVIVDADGTLGPELIRLRWLADSMLVRHSDAAVPLFSAFQFRLAAL